MAIFGCKEIEHPVLIGDAPWVECIGEYSRASRIFGGSRILDPGGGSKIFGEGGGRQVKQGLLPQHRGVKMPRRGDIFSEGARHTL